MPRKITQIRTVSSVFMSPNSTCPLPPAEYKPQKRRRTVGLNWHYDQMMDTLTSVPSKRSHDPKRRKTQQALPASCERSVEQHSSAYTRFCDAKRSKLPIRDTGLRVKSPDMSFETASSSTVHGPLPEWLADTFSESLEHDNPLRLLLPKRSPQSTSPRMLSDSDPFISPRPLSPAFPATLSSDDRTLYPRPTSRLPHSRRATPFSKPGLASSIRVTRNEPPPIKSQFPVTPGPYHLLEDPTHGSVSASEPPYYETPADHVETTCFAFNVPLAASAGENKTTDDVNYENLDSPFHAPDWSTEPLQLLPKTASTSTFATMESTQSRTRPQHTLGLELDTDNDTVDFRWDPFIQQDTVAAVPSTFDLFQDVANTSLSPTLIDDAANNRFQTPGFVTDEDWTVHFSSPRMVMSPDSPAESQFSPKKVPFAPAPGIYISPLCSRTNSDIDANLESR